MVTNKKAAIELSIGTIVVIVLAMSMLILGLVLIRNIFAGSTATVDILNDKVKSAVSSLFSDEGQDVVVNLGSDNTAKVKSGSGNFGIAIGARTPDGSQVGDRARLQYKLSLDTSTTQNCLTVLGSTQTNALFIAPQLNKDTQFDSFQAANAFARIGLNIPAGTAACSQKVFIDVTDKRDNKVVGGNFFVLEIQKAGIFG